MIIKDYLIFYFIIIFKLLNYQIFKLIKCIQN